jgi:tetrahydromethanopterin S-methyltransferase subunit A
MDGMHDERSTGQPAIVGDVVFGDMASPVAVCTLSSRRLLPLLAGRPEIAVAGRVFTENIGVEKMIQNLAAMPSIRYLIVCGHESAHRVGQTILALHSAGLDGSGRVIWSNGPEPFLSNLTPDQLRAFQSRVTVVDMIGTGDADEILARARTLMHEAPTDLPSDEDAADPASARADVVVATSNPDDAWQYDPTGFFVVFVERARQRLRVEQYGQDRRLSRIFEGVTAEALSHTIIREGQITVLEHAAYLGRELAKAETALRLGLDYEQDVTLRLARSGDTYEP